MTFSEFLDHTKVLKMLYGREIAEAFYKKNIDNFYDLEYSVLSASINNTESE